MGASMLGFHRPRRMFHVALLVLTCALPTCKREGAEALQGAEPPPLSPVAAMDGLLKQTWRTDDGDATQRYAEMFRLYEEAGAEIDADRRDRMIALLIEGGRMRECSIEKVEFIDRECAQMSTKKLAGLFEAVLPRARNHSDSLPADRTTISEAFAILGSRIAQISNPSEATRDIARLRGLGILFRAIEELRVVAERQADTVRVRQLEEYEKASREYLRRRPS